MFQRRLSEPSSNAPPTFRSQKPQQNNHLGGHKSRSENEGLDHYNVCTFSEIEAGDVRDGEAK